MKTFIKISLLWVILIAGVEGQTDTDSDGIPDSEDNCPEVFNEIQLDFNENNIGDVCEEISCEDLDEYQNNIELNEYNSCEVDSDCILFYPVYEPCCTVVAVNNTVVNEFYNIQYVFFECEQYYDCSDVDCLSFYSVCSNNVCTAILYQYDCTGTYGGTAFIDDCGNCVGGNTGLEENYAMDCAGVCDGEAYENECGCISEVNDWDPEFCYGCTDPNSCGYEPDATIDDGSCVYEPQFECVLDVDGDLFWEDYVGSCEPCDSLGAGWYDFWGPGGFIGPEIYGCTDLFALNYDPEATEDDGSCEYEEVALILDPQYINFVRFVYFVQGDSSIDSIVTPQYFPNGLPQVIKVNDTQIISYVEGYGWFGAADHFNTEDYYRFEPGELLFTYPGARLMGCTDPDALNYHPNATLNDGGCEYLVTCYSDDDCDEGLVCIPPFGDCNFETGPGDCVDASWNNNCDMVDTNYVCACDGETYANECVAVERIGTGVAHEGACETDGYGCTDPNANNYNPNAVYNDGSCDFVNKYCCTDPAACNYNPYSICDDGDCYYDFCYGCPDPEALNFDPNAINDDGSCQYSLCYSNSDCEEGQACIPVEAGDCGLSSGGLCVPYQNTGNYICNEPQYSNMPPVCGCDGQQYDSACEAVNMFGVPVSTDNDCFNQSDLDVLQDFIDLNDSLEGQEPLEIGVQEWTNGRLTELWLISLQLTNIPETIGNLTSLTKLKLSFNQLISLPESIGNLSFLTHLNLDNNQFTNLPVSIGNLSNLTYLWLNDNQFTIIPEYIYDLPDLVYLRLNNNQLTSIPESISDLSNLTKLFLDNNQLVSLPENIGSFSSLSTLHLEYNQLVSLPESICNLPNSCNINVSYNNLCEEFHFDCIDYWGNQDCNDEQTDCFTNDDCEEGFVCIPPFGDCEFETGPGECMDQQDGCSGGYAPVCGCDGVTYPNECQANILNGVGIAYEGACELTCCSDPNACNFDPGCGIENFGCDYPEEFGWCDCFGNTDCSIGAECALLDEFGVMDCNGQCQPSEDLQSSLGNESCDDSFSCPEFGYDCGDCNENWDGSDPLGYCEEVYTGPVWNISPTGSDETGDGSPENPFAGIQHGIDMTADGDTVLLLPGTYMENINFNGHNIVVGSMFIMTGDTGYISQTIIDGSGYSNSSVVTFDSDETDEAKLIGLTIKNGDADFDGGGISCYSASPTLEYLIIEDNWAGYSCSWDGSGSGGGISLKYSNSVIKNSIVRNNRICAGEGWAGSGGGIYCVDSNLELENVQITGNISGPGVGLFVDNSTLLMKNCTVSDNDLSPFIYGENLLYNGNAMVVFNSQVIALNSIFWGTEPLQDIVEVDSEISIRYSDVQEGWEGEGNINTDPLFVDPENGNYYLQPDSPCIDAGDPDSPPDPDGTVADMGAFYFDQSDNCSMTGDMNNDHQLDVLDVVVVVGCILEMSDDCPCGDMTGDGVVDVLDVVQMVDAIMGG